MAGPVAWNSLPLHIRSAPTLLAFKNMLKTHLFSRSYFTQCFAGNIVRRPRSHSSHVTAPYKLSFYYYCYFINTSEVLTRVTVQLIHIWPLHRTS